MSCRTAVINVAAAATGTLVAAVPQRSIRVHAFVVCGSAANTIAGFYTTDSGAPISGSLRTEASGHVRMPFCAEGYFETEPGNALNLIATTGDVTGFVRHSVV